MYLVSPSRTRFLGASFKRNILALANPPHLLAHRARRTLVGPRDIGKTAVTLATAEAFPAARLRRCEESLRC
jgi:hypothetical protein